MPSRPSRNEKIKNSERYQKRRALLNGSLRDYLAAETVYTSEHAEIVKALMHEYLGYTMNLANYGDVLIHRGTESPSLEKII